MRVSLEPEGLNIAVNREPLSTGSSVELNRGGYSEQCLISPLLQEESKELRSEGSDMHAPLSIVHFAPKSNQGIYRKNGRATLNHKGKCCIMAPLEAQGLTLLKVFGGQGVLNPKRSRNKKHAANQKDPNMA